MNIGGYELPMIGTIMPWLLTIMVVASGKIIIGRLWADKEVNFKKMGLLMLAIGICFVGILYMNQVIGWIWDCIKKIMELVNSIKFN